MHFAITDEEARRKIHEMDDMLKKATTIEFMDSFIEIVSGAMKVENITVDSSVDILHLLTSFTQVIGKILDKTNKTFAGTGSDDLSVGVSLQKKMDTHILITRNHSGAMHLNISFAKPHLDDQSLCSASIPDSAFKPSQINNLHCVQRTDSVHY